MKLTKNQRKLLCDELSAMKARIKERARQDKQAAKTKFPNIMRMYRANWDDGRVEKVMEDLSRWGQWDLIHTITDGDGKDFKIIL